MEDRELIVKTSAYIDRHRDEMLSLWEKIVSIESGTPDKEGVDRVGAVLKDELESAGSGRLVSGNRRRAVPVGAVAVPVPVAADAAVSITIQLRKLIKPERMGV